MKENDKDDDLVFQTLGDETLLATPIFDLVRRDSVSPRGRRGGYILAKAPDWANVVAVVADEQGRDCFLMVRQYRHGDGLVYWEFPGGMVDKGESPADAASRELLEETGWEADRLDVLGHCNPNPSFLTNNVWTFVAHNARKVRDHLDLDPNEHLRVGLLPVDEVRRRMGDGLFGHGIMILALYWWERRLGLEPR